MSEGTLISAPGQLSVEQAVAVAKELLHLLRVRREGGGISIIKLTFKAEVLLRYLLGKTYTVYAVELSSSRPYGLEVRGATGEALTETVINRIGSLAFSQLCESDLELGLREILEEAKNVFA